MCSMPLPRTQMNILKREEYNAAGEATTQETSYTGVPMAPWGSLPLTSKEDKEKILGFDPVLPTGKKTIFDCSVGLLLFWQERRTVAFTKRLLKDAMAAAVFDLTPGSGACGRACIEMGLPYSCLARSPEHASWLQNVFDRCTLREICKKGSVMNNVDLAELIKTHFQETLDQLNEQDLAEDTEFKDE